MSVTVSPASSDRKRGLAALFRSSDREFLPPALQILETPPSPVRLWLIGAICLFVVLAIVWMYFGKIDVIAVAPGKIEPVGRVKVVQPIESGQVRDLFVSNGSLVHQGDVVAQLDDSAVRAEQRASADLLASSRAEARRRSVAIGAALHRQFDGVHVDWPVGTPKEIADREDTVLAGDIAALKSNIESFAAQKLQKEAETTKLAAQIDSQEKLLGIEQQRVDLRATLEKRQLGTKLGLLDAQETLQIQQTSLAQQKGQLAESKAAIEVLTRDLEKAVSTFVAENSQKMADAEKQAADAKEKLSKAISHTDQMRLTAPVTGIVQGLAITTKGQVVTPGEEVMRIIPSGAKYQIEAYVANKDIGFLQDGQEAVVKVESFPFTTYGTLPAKITRVSTEAIPEPDAQQKQADAASPSRALLPSGAQRLQNLVFPVTLSLEKSAIESSRRNIPVSNGMSVTVEIKTGQRRIIDYILSPLIDVGSSAMRER